MSIETKKRIEELNADLIHAIKTDTAGAFENALSRGASVEARDQYGNTALMVAVDCQRLPMIQRLIALRANVNARTGSFPQTPLHLSAQQESTIITELLLQHGADIHAVGWHGQTPFHAACAAGRLPQVRVLLDRGAMATGAGNSNFDPPLITALGSRQLEIAGYLLSRHPDLFKNCNGTGLSPLAYFARAKDHAGVAWLLSQPMPDWIRTDQVLFRNAVAEADTELDEWEQFDGYEAAKAATIEVLRQHGNL